jgi:hypothetical protein
LSLQQRERHGAPCPTASPLWRSYRELPRRYTPSNAEDRVWREAVPNQIRVLLVGAVVAAWLNELEPHDGDVLQATTLIASLGSSPRLRRRLTWPP